LLATAPNGAIILIKQYQKELNDDLIKQAKLKAGIKGYAANLGGSAEMIIGAYRNLLEVEKSFRIVKSDLKERPIFRQKRDSIEAHLTICFGAFAISRYIQEKTKISILTAYNAFGVGLDKTIYILPTLKSH
jgi:transposase